MNIEVTSLDEYLGAVSGSLCSKRGRIVRMETKGRTAVISGMVPLSQMFGYSTELRTITSGKADFSMHFEHYEALPFSLAEEIAAARRDR